MTSTALIDQLCPERPKAKSLIVSVYGDALLPLGGCCWLGELIDLMALFDLNERVTRTAVFRLVQDGILEAERVGRRSRYTLTSTGRRQFDSAQTRIYASTPPQRDGRWSLIVLPDSIAPAQRDQLVQRLGWQGFARLAPGLLGAARGDLIQQADEVLADLALSEECGLFVAEAASVAGLLPLAARSWPLQEIAGDYNRFLDHFGPLTATAATLTGDQAFMARVLLIHAYRRALLRDPVLPDDLLPADWPGARARALARNLYLDLTPATDRYLETVLEIDRQTATRPSRFGG